MHKIEVLPLAREDLLEIVSGLSGLRFSAAAKFVRSVERVSSYVALSPMLYPAYAENPYYRSAPLPYRYRLFYHVDDEGKTVAIHRAIHGTWDVADELA